MTNEIKLGKIQNVRFGLGGYQDASIGIHFAFCSESWGVSDSNCFWSPTHVEVTENTKWTEADRDKNFAEIVRYVDRLLSEAKVDSVEKLKGKPVEIVFEGNMLKSWRILTEVL